jgi:uncharacterized membrane protein YhaH (DUF805 family)
MGFPEAVKGCLQKYATFTGRASRSEFWWFVLFTVIASIVASMLGEVVNGLVSLGLLLPSIAVGARRLHDIGKTGWLQLLWIIPVVGWIVLIYWAVQPGEGDNQYGAATGPSGATAAVAPGQQ